MPLPASRRQLTLFVPPRAAEPIEAVRRELDPIQHDLIAAHVTLCRESELGTAEPDAFARRLSRAGRPPLTLTFGEPEAFMGHGILLPCIEGEERYHALRAILLDGCASEHPRPHITLAHPRNPRSPGNSLVTARRLPSGLSLTFDRVSLIQQHTGGPWSVLASFPLDTESCTP